MEAKDGSQIENTVTDPRERIRRFGHDQLATYGIGADLDARRPFRGFEMAVRSSSGRGLRWIAIAGVPRTSTGKFWKLKLREMFPR